MARHDFDHDDNNVAQGFRANLGSGTVRDTTGNFDVLSGVEDVSGSIFDDVLIGSGGSGDSGQNDLSGHGGNDTLDGRFGIDFLSGEGFRGGVGADTFVFSTRLRATNNFDYVRDFQHLVDHLLLSASIFSALGATVGVSELRFGTVAVDANDFLVYDQASGRISYDANRSGVGGQTLFAILAAGTTLTAGDFAIG